MFDVNERRVHEEEVQSKRRLSDVVHEALESKAKEIKSCEAVTRATASVFDSLEKLKKAVGA